MAIDVSLAPEKRVDVHKLVVVRIFVLADDRNLILRFYFCRDPAPLSVIVCFPIKQDSICLKWVAS